MKKQYVIKGKWNLRKLQECDIAYQRLPTGNYIIVKDRSGRRLEQILTYEELVLELL